MELIPYQEEHRIFRRTLQAFLAREVVPFVEEWEEAGIVPRSAWKKMGEHGFLCPDVPEAYGGAFLNISRFFITVSEGTRH